MPDFVAPPSAPWLAPDLLPEAALGGEPGVWRGASCPMNLEAIEASLRNQAPDEKSPIHWVEVPGAPRVVHVSEVPALRDAQRSRDERLLRAVVRRNQPLALGAGFICVFLLALGLGRGIFLPALFTIQWGDDWLEAAATLRRLRRRPEAYFRQRALEARYAVWLHHHGRWDLWRTWSLTGAWAAVFVLQLTTGFDASISKAALVKPLVYEGQLWRLLTGPMLHGSFLHIFMNGAASLSVAMLVERTAHRHVLIPLWLASALGGSLLSAALMPAQTSVGASGGLMGMIGFLAVMGLRRRALMPPGLVAGIFRSIALMGVFGILAWAVLDNAAHLGGLATGAILGLGLFRREAGALPLRDSVGLSVVGWGALAALAALLAFTVWMLLGPG